MDSSCNNGKGPWSNADEQQAIRDNAENVGRQRMTRSLEVKEKTQGTCCCPERGIGRS